MHTGLQLSNFGLNFYTILFLLCIFLEPHHLTCYSPLLFSQAKPANATSKEKQASASHVKE